SAGVLLIDPFLATTQARLVTHRIESRETLLIRRQRRTSARMGLSLCKDSRHDTGPFIHRNGEQLLSSVDNRVLAHIGPAVACRSVPPVPSIFGPIDPEVMPR